MELCNENLATMITNKNKIFTISEIKEILNQLNNSFKIMNENKMAHRDLKPQNILVKYKNENDKNEFIIKLSDYGEASILTMTRKVFSSNAGTLDFMAPEILNREPYDLKCDLWSLGVIIYILYFRIHPENLKYHIQKSKKEDFDKIYFLKLTTFFL